MNRSIEVSQGFDQSYLLAQKSLNADGSRVSGCHGEGGRGIEEIIGCSGTTKGESFH